MGSGTGTNYLLPSYIETLATNGTVRFQTADPTNTTPTGNFTIRLGTNLIFATSAGSKIEVACSIDQTNFNGGTAYSVPYSIIKTNPGTLSLLSSNNFTGGVIFYAGTLNVGNGQALGAPTGNFTISGDTISSRTIDNSSGSALTLSNYPNTWGGDFAFKGTSDLNLGAGGVTLGASPQITVTSGNLRVDGVIGPSGGGFGLTKTGNGTLILNAANTYNGNTTVSAGNLTLGASASIANSPNISANGTLDVSAVSGFALGSSQSLLGSGSVTGSVATASGSKIIPGTAGTTGTLTLANTLTLASGVTNYFDLGSTAAGANDKLIVNGTGTALTLNNNTFVIKATATLDVASDYTLVSVPNGTISGTFNSAPTWSGTPPASAGNYSVVTSANTVTLHYSAPAAGIDHLVVSTSVGTTNAGDVFAITVQAKDASNISITDGSVDGTLVIMSSSGSAQFDGDGNSVFGDNFRALTNGTCTIYAKDNLAQTINLIATAGVAAGTNFNFVITPGPLAQLQLLLPGETAAPSTLNGKTGTPAAQTAGTGFSVTVNAVDANWNVVSSSDIVSLTASNAPNAVLPANTALSGGSVTLSVTNLLAGSGRTLTAADVSNGGITSSTSPAYTVVPSAVTRLVILAPGESVTLGAAPGKTGSPSAQYSTVGYSVTVDALDAQYNLVTNATDTVGVSSSAGGDTLPGNAALIGGTKTFSLTNNTVGSATLTASDVSNGGVTAGAAIVPVSINTTTTAVTSSANPANAGQSITFTATVSGAGKRTGTVTFKNGATAFGNSTLSANTATLSLSGGAGTCSITAVYNGDANNNASTSSALSQVIQTGGAVANPAQMEDGIDYATFSVLTATTGSTPVTIPGMGVWQANSATSLSTATSSHGLVKAGDLTGTTTPALKPLPNQTTNVAAHIEISKGASDREMLRSIGTPIASGSAYVSLLVNASVNPTTTDEPMMTVMTNGAANAPLGNDPVTLHTRQGGDTTHFNLGIQRLGGTIVWASASLSMNTDYLVVVKYTFGGADSLYINPVPGNSEPGVPDAVTATGGTDPANVGTIQFYESGTPAPVTSGTFNYDVIRADNNWANVTPPVGASGLGAASLAFSPTNQVIQVNQNSALITVSLLNQSNTTYNATADTVVALSSTSAAGTFRSSADGTTVISSVTISNGTSTATFYYRDSAPGSFTLTGASGLLTPAVQTLVVTPDLSRLGHITVTNSLSSTAAGIVFTATVQAYDVNNVAVTDNSFDGAPITFTSSGLAQFDANGDAIYGDNVKGLVNGTCTINTRDLKAESMTVTAGLGTNTATSTSVSISAVAFAGLQVLLPGESAAPGTVTGRTGTPTAEVAGTGFNITVRAVDVYWNSVSSGDTVHIAQSGDANVIVPADTALVSGTATLSLTNILTGAGQTLTASDVSNGSITSDTSSAYMVVSGAAVRLVLLAPGESPTFGAAPGKTGTPSDQLQTGSFSVVVYALDAYYNLAQNNTDVVHFTSSDGVATLPANAALVGGTKTFAMKNNTQGIVTNTASDVSNGGVASGSTILTVDPVQNYRSVQSGNWGDATTWEYSNDGGTTWTPAVTTPSSSILAVVEVTNGITVTVASSVSVNRTTVDAGATVAVSPGATLAVVSGSGVDLDVFGSLSNAGTITRVSPAIIYLHNGATYYHNQDGGSIVTATWETNSTCDVIGWVAATTVSSTTGMKQKFGNFTWNSPSQTNTLSFGSSTPTDFEGSFNVISTGSGVLELSISAAVNLIVGGDVNISGGTFNGITTSATEIVNVGGDLNVSGGTFNLHSSATGSGSSVWNVSGNVNVTGGTLTASSTNSSPTINFVKTGTQKLTVSGSGSIPTSSKIAWNVASSSILDLGTNVVHGTGSFTVSPGGGVMTAKVSGFAGNLGLPSANISLSLGNCIYAGASTQSGDTLLPAAVSGLTINNSHGVVLNQSETVTSLNLNGSPMTGSVTISAAGAFTVTGTNSTVIGNVTMTSGSLVLVSSNTLPELTVQGGALSLVRPVGITLTVLGSALPQGSYLLVNANAGGSVTGTPANLATVNGSGLLSGLTGAPKIVGGNLYLSVVALYPVSDAGNGFFGGENLILTNASGMSFFAWSSANPFLSVSNWNLEGPMEEQPLNDGTGRSYYSINVTPGASPTYYVCGTTAGGPYLVSPVPVETLTTSDYSTFGVTSSTVAVSAAGVLDLVPSISSGSTGMVGGAFQFQFTGPSGPYSVWASTNLTSWTSVATGTFSGVPVTFTDAATTNYPLRFYRVSVP